MISITKSAIKAMKVRMNSTFLVTVSIYVSDILCISAMKSLLSLYGVDHVLACFLFHQLYKHVVQIVEKFIKKVSRAV